MLLVLRGLVDRKRNKVTKENLSNHLPPRLGKAKPERILILVWDSLVRREAERVGGVYELGCLIR